MTDVLRAIAGCEPKARGALSRKRVRGRLASLVATLAACSIGGAARAQEPLAPPLGGAGVPVRGRFTLGGTLRDTSGASDADLHGFLSVDAGDPELHPFTFHAASRLAWDVDADDGDVFDGISDTYSHAVTARLYDAWIDVHDVEHVPLVRIGRQSDYETPDPVLYDGVRLESQPFGPREVRFGLYGGVSNHLYESSPSGDYLGGAYVDGRPWRRGRVRLDWMRAADELASDQELASLLGVSAWQTLTHNLSARASYTLLEGRNRDLDLGATWYDPEPDFTVRASYYRLFETQSANPLEFDTFATTLLDYFPFDRYGLVVAKGISRRLRIEAGTDLRDVHDDDDEGVFNRDVWRTWVTATVDEVLSPGTSVSVTGDVWESDNQETSSFGADLSHEFSETTNASLGTYYALYEFDALLVAEREDVRVYYVKAQRELSDALDLQVGFDFEDADIDFTRLRVKLSWRF